MYLVHVVAPRDTLCDYNTMLVITILVTTDPPDRC